MTTNSIVYFFFSEQFVHFVRIRGVIGFVKSRGGNQEPRERAVNVVCCKYAVTLLVRDLDVDSVVDVQQENGAA